MTAESGTPSGSPSSPPQPRRLGWVLAPFLVFLAITGLFAFALTVGDPSKLPSALIGKPVPVADFPALEELVDNGKPVPGFGTAELSRGEVSVVNFWASWCVPCVEEHPLLIELKTRTSVPLYGVNHKDQPASGRRFLARFGNPFTAVGTDRTGRGAIEWGVYGMPETFVIDGEGRIAHKHVGPISKASLEQQMIPAIAAAREAAAEK